MYRILLIDDDRESHKMLSRLCRGIGIVLQANDGREARTLLQRNNIDLVIIEHRLKAGSGLRLLATMKDQMPSLPVIMWTTHGSEALCAMALKLGVRDYFAKRWPPSSILASIEAILAVTRQSVGQRRNILPVPRLFAGDGDSIVQAIRKASELIVGQPEETQTFEQLARELQISKPTLSRRFKKVLEVPYRRFVLEARVSRAKELLDCSDLTITDIAQSVGFSDLPRFDKVFKAVVGLTPSDYRRNTSPRNKRQDARQQTTSQHWLGQF
jgi:YesN/AraC family two-component response regulator